MLIEINYQDKIIKKEFCWGLGRHYGPVLQNINQVTITRITVLDCSIHINYSIIVFLGNKTSDSHGKFSILLNEFGDMGSIPGLGRSHMPQKN